MQTRLAALAATLAVAATGCRDNLASIEIFAICAPPDDAAACGTTGSCGAFLASDRPFAFVSVNGATNELQVFVQINNQTPQNDDLDTGRVNTNDFIGEEYLFHFRGMPGLSDVVHPANFTVPAGGSFTPVVPVIPFSTMTQVRALIGAAARATVIVEMQVRGHFIDGTELETGVYEIAVDILNADFLVPGCPTATDVRFFCPNAGQTASTDCATP